MALTLIDSNRERKDDFSKGVVETFVQECDILKKLPIATIGTVETSSRRTNSLPTVGWRARGETPGAVSGGAHDIVSDAVYSMAGQIDIDKTDYMDKALAENPLTSRTREAVKGMSWTFNNAFINGDHATDADMYEGIKVRIANLASAMTTYASTSTAELDVRQSAAPTNAVMFQWLDRMDDAIYSLDGHSADVILTHADMIKAINSAKRRLGINKDNKEVTEPHLGGSNKRRTSAQPQSKPVADWNGVPMYDMGLAADQSTDIIATELVNAVATRPIYFLKLGEPYLTGIQQYPLDVTKPEKLNDGVTYRVTVDWPVGLKDVHPKFGHVVKGQRVA